MLTSVCPSSLLILFWSGPEKKNGVEEVVLYITTFFHICSSITFLFSIPGSEKVVGTSPDLGEGKQHLAHCLRQCCLLRALSAFSLPFIVTKVFSFIAFFDSPLLNHKTMSTAYVCRATHIH